MKYYAHHGITEFILCLGYRGDCIKNYFVNYDECLSNDFVLTQGGQKIQLQNSDIDKWKITFADTGLHTNLAHRLQCVRKYLDDDEVFMANYTDGLTDLPLGPYLEHFYRQRRVATFLAVRPSQSFHLVTFGADNIVTGIQPAAESDVWINGGFFVFTQQIFNYFRDGEDLVDGTLQRLLTAKQLTAYRYRGFWACMDTLKEKQSLDALYESGAMPWALWERTSQYQAAQGLMDCLNGGMALEQRGLLCNPSASRVRIDRAK
jgi:glucose-1-phosphate cytidylyltransferase